MKEKFISPNSRQSGSTPKVTPRANNPRKEGDTSFRGNELKVKVTKQKEAWGN